MDPIWLSNRNGSLPDLTLLNSKWQTFLIIIYTTTAVISLASNIVTIIVLIKGERLTSELWKYLINLSVADISMALFCIPFTYTMFMLGHWIFPKWLCQVVQFTQVCSVLISVYTLTIIGIDRYFAIVYPFQRSIYLKSHKKIMLCIVWIVAIGIALIPYFKTKAVPFQYGNETYYDCRELWGEEGGKNYTLFLFFVTFALPISVLTFVYTSICWYILRHNTPGNPDRVRDLAQWKLKIKVVKMLITIVILFAVCWLPIHVFNIIVWFFPPKMSTSETYAYDVYVFSYFFCHFLSMSHSFINPFVYGFMSENFKLSLRRLLTRMWYKRRLTDTEMDKLSTSHNTQELTRLNSNSI